jgi:phosphonate transport system substrate-binding protein
MPTSAKMTDALRTGAVHLLFESPLVAAKIAQDGAALPMLRRWRKGVAEYWSEIVVPSESPVRSLEDLRGRIIAFEDPDSTSGHLLPRAVLLERGLEVELLKRWTDPVDPKKVGAVFTLSDKGSILMLFDGRVAALATDPLYVKRVEEARPGALRSIARSITVPRHVVMRSVAMSEERAKRIADVLTGMYDTEEGRRVLAQFRETDRFDAFPEGVEATFAPLKAQLQVLEAGASLVTGTQ